MSQTILVTGATSGLGRNAIDSLLSHGTACIATGRNLDAGKALTAAGARFIPADLATASDSQLQQLLTGVDVVWHAAALSSPWGAYDDFYRANVHASTRLAKAACQMGVRRFVHISTPSVYFDYRHRHDISEAQISRRYVNHYAHTKRLAEFALNDIAKNHPDTDFIALRPRAIFGAYDRVLLPKILALHSERGYLPLPRGAQVMMDITYAQNVVHAMHLATTADFARLSRPDPSLAHLPVYNITNSAPIRLYTLLDKLFSELKLNLRIKSVPYPILATLAWLLESLGNLKNQEPKLTAYSAGVLHYDMVLNIDKAKSELNYQPIISQDDAIAATAQYLKHLS